MKANVIAVRLWRLVLMLWLAVLAQAAQAQDGMYGIGLRELNLVDQSRSIKPSRGFAGSETRRIEVKVWYPAATGSDVVKSGSPIAEGGPFPLLIYSHGAYGFADNNMHMVTALVRAGYVVAAPDYSLSSRKAFTRINGVDVSDVAEQVKDLGFVIDRVTQDGVIGRAVDAERIGVAGHSLGAITSYFAAYAQNLRDPRIKALVSIAAGDPVQMALANDMGLSGTHHAAVSVPVLFLSAEKDVFARTSGRPYAAYSRVEPPKYELMIARGTHIWFRDGDEQAPDNLNVDCTYLQPYMPDTIIPGCDEHVPLIGPARQQEITRIAIGAFLDAYLKGDAQALARLDHLGDELPDAGLRHEK